MAQRTLPFRDGMALGYGTDDLSGAVSSMPAVDVGTPSSADGDTGMSGSYQTVLVHSATQMYEELGVSAGINVGVAAKAAEADFKFRFAEKSAFNSSSTFLVATAQIASSFKRIAMPEPVEDAKELFRLGKLDQFRLRYGDNFIRGVSSGGDYVAVIAITSKTQVEQRELGMAFKMSLDVAVASGEVPVELSERIATLSAHSDVRVATYQRGGRGEKISYAGTVAEVVKRMREFSAVVEKDPKAYSVQVASYDTLVFPEGPDEFDIKRQREALEECQRQKVQLQTYRNDVEMVLVHPDYYESPPSPDTLSRWSTELTDKLNELEDHAAAVRDDPQKAEALPFTLPPGLKLPKRILHSSKQVEVFNRPDFGKTPKGSETPRSQKLEIGRYGIGELTVGNDEISSLKVPEGLGVRAYEHAWFQGETIDFTEDISRLGSDWAGKISCVAVYDTATGPPRVTEVVAFDFPWSRWLVLGPGRYPNLAATAVGAETISTLLIPRGMAVRLWDEADFKGRSEQFTSDILQMHADWDNCAGSMEVIDLQANPA